MSGKPAGTAQQRAHAAFRARYRRFDYVPGEAALAAIEGLRIERPGLSMRRVIDALVVAGAISGNRDSGGRT